MRILRGGSLAVAGAVAVLAAGSARAQVDVWSGGLASDCAQAARSGDISAQAETTCTESIDKELLTPLDRAGTYVNRGILKLRGKRYDEAIADFDIAIRYRSDLAEAYVNRAAARIGVLRYSDALADVDNALMLQVKEPEKAWYNRAVAHEHLDQVPDAIADYRKAIELAPDWDLPRQQLARYSMSHPIDALPVAPSLADRPRPQ